MYPVLFELGRFQVRTYSVFLLLAFIAGILILRFLIKRRTLIDVSIVTDLAFWVIIGVVIGSRLFYVLMHIPEFADNWTRAFYIWEGGAVYYGGFIFALIFGGLYLWIHWKRKFPNIGFKGIMDKLASLMDVVAPAVALGEGIGRVGCYFNGCCFGHETEVCGITYPARSFASAIYGYPHSVLPTPLFQALGGLLLFLILLLVFRFVRTKKGQLFGIFIFLFGALRLGVNFLRYYEDNLNLWTNNWVAIGIMAAGLVLIFVFGRSMEPYPPLSEIAAERRRLKEAEERKKKKKD